MVATTVKKAHDKAWWGKRFWVGGSFKSEDKKNPTHLTDVAPD